MRNLELNQDKCIVVTGGAGFIGSGIIRYLNDRGIDRIVVVDDLGTDEKWKNLVKKSFMEFLPIEGLLPWLQGREDEIEAFIHLGACSSTVERNAQYLLENNYAYTISLMEYALENEIRFIYASSAATYGDGSLGFSDDHSKLQEFEPLNMYGYSKHMVDLWAQREGVLDQVVGLKYFNVFGPNEYHKDRMASAVLKMVPQVLAGERIKLFKSSDPEQFGDGEQKRDFIYVKDAARMTCSFLTNDLGGIFNIGTGIPSTWNQLATAVLKALGKPVEIDYIPMPEDLIGKYQNYTCAEMGKHSHPSLDGATLPLEQSVADYVKNYILKGKIW